jgi:hypothetical protein
VADDSTVVDAQTAPAGPITQIALRFLRALQHHDEAAAASELSLVGRAYFAVHDETVLYQVMRDVAVHAQLDQAGVCTRAERLTAEAVVVRCGVANVVVHVQPDPLTTGVQLARWHVRGDVYDGPHTHAFTTVVL